MFSLVIDGNNRSIRELPSKILSDRHTGNVAATLPGYDL